MKRIYVTTIPLQGRLDLAKNTYRSSANSSASRPVFPIPVYPCTTRCSESDDFHIIAIRSVNGDTQRNPGYLKEELQAMGFTGNHIRELPMPDEQDCSTRIRLCRDLCDVLPEKKRHRLHGHHPWYQDHPWCSWRLSPCSSDP